METVILEFELDTETATFLLSQAEKEGRTLDSYIRRVVKAHARCQQTPKSAVFIQHHSTH